MSNGAVNIKTLGNVGYHAVKQKPYLSRYDFNSSIDQDTLIVLAPRHKANEMALLPPYPFLD